MLVFVKRHFRAQSALSDSSAGVKPDKATTPSIVDSPSEILIPNSFDPSCEPVASFQASTGTRTPAPVGMTTPSKYDSCAATRKVIFGRTCGGNGSTTTMMTSTPYSLQRSIRPARRGSERSKSAVCKIAAASVPPFEPGPWTRRQDSDAWPGFAGESPRPTASAAGPMASRCVASAATASQRKPGSAHRLTLLAAEKTIRTRMIAIGFIACGRHSASRARRCSHNCAGGA